MSDEKEEPSIEDLAALGAGRADALNSISKAVTDLGFQGAAGNQFVPGQDAPASYVNKVNIKGEDEEVSGLTITNSEVEAEDNKLLNPDNSSNLKSALDLTKDGQSPDFIAGVNAAIVVFEDFNKVK